MEMNNEQDVNERDRAMLFVLSKDLLYLQSCFNGFDDPVHGEHLNDIQRFSKWGIQRIRCIQAALDFCYSMSLSITTSDQLKRDICIAVGHANQLLRHTDSEATFAATDGKYRKALEICETALHDVRDISSASFVHLANECRKL